jgi:RNA polymerase sigma factor (sigma-70 family)
MHHRATASIGERFPAADHEAIAEQHRATAQGIHDFLVRMVRDRAAAEDLTQATYLRAFERRSSLAEGERVTGWLYAIARNLALDHLRGRGRRPETSLEESTMTTTTETSTMPDPERTMLQNEAVALVWDAAASLEPRQAAVLDLSLRHGLGPTDIAAALETSPEHAAVLVNRARSALGGAVRYLAVARRRGRCERLDALVPAGIRQLTPAQRKSVDHHLRRCGTCQDTAAVLTAPDALYAATPLLALPAVLHTLPDVTSLGGGASVSPGTATAPSPSSAPARAPSSSSALVAVGVAGVAAVVVIAAALLVLRARSSDDASPPSTIAVVVAGGPAAGGGSSASGSGNAAPGPSSAPLVTSGSGTSTFMALDGVIVSTEGCDVAMFQSAPDPGGSLFLLGNLHLDGDRLVLDGTSDAFTGELHQDGIFHLETHTGSSAESTIDARIGEDGKVTGVWTDVFLGECVLHAEIKSGDAPTIAKLTS